MNTKSRFLILNTGYLKFLRWVYSQYPGLEKSPKDTLCQK